MARAFRCKECGTGYSTTGEDVPPSPNWDDGHRCVMTEVESKIPLFEPRRMDLKSENEFKEKWKKQQGLPKVDPSNMKVEQDPFMLSQLTEEERDARMKNIGQNGNTGEHYG
tara:strand:+ start:40652 stop:40987 length:336 start_codon:yes stop_codon:yes gene_type:complete